MAHLKKHPIALGIWVISRKTKRAGDIDLRWEDRFFCFYTTHTVDQKMLQIQLLSSAKRIEIRS